jgi:hypothetical protein
LNAIEPIAKTKSETKLKESMIIAADPPNSNGYVYYSGTPVDSSIINEDLNLGLRT